jgi:hypothetical protein
MFWRVKGVKESHVARVHASGSAVLDLSRRTLQRDMVEMDWENVCATWFTTWPQQCSGLAAEHGSCARRSCVVTGMQVRQICSMEILYGRSKMD